MAELKLTRGKVATVDTADLQWLTRWKWQAVKSRHTWYAARTVEAGGQRQTIYLHRAVFERHYHAIPPGLQIDHKDGNGLNCVPGNLRLTSQTLNLANARKRAGCSSRYKGVGWSKSAGKWRARIKVVGRARLLGYFDSEEAAAAAYDRVAREVFHDYARLNFGQAA